MADRSSHPNALDEPNVPARLVEELGRLHRIDLPAVSPGIDDAILREARGGYTRRRRFWLAARAVGAAAAAAAAVVTAVLYVDRSDPVRPPVAGTQRAVSQDLDGNGVVDIVDAYLLARRVEGKSGEQLGADVNGDGVADRRDVDAVAAAAVRL